MKNFRVDIYKFLLIVAVLSFVAVWLLEAQQKEVLKAELEGATMVETINSGVQRISKLELENSSDQSLIIILNDIARTIVPSNGVSKYFSTNQEMSQIMVGFIDDWYKFKETVEDYRISGDRDSLFEASEHHYTQSIIVVEQVSLYITDLTNMVDNIDSILVTQVAAMVLLLLKILFNTINELKKNKELSKDMFIDLSTGLYNRSKCQELFSSTFKPDEGKERVVLVFDLNDLKKTNDASGHRVGDDLISCFAKQLKDATNVFKYEVFAGRYGGDEFVVYFSSADEVDVSIYLDELNYLVDRFNMTEKKPFKLSFAVGHSITTKKTREFSMRELFDIADKNMYENKMAMKEIRRQELEAQGVVDNTIDERLI